MFEKCLAVQCKIKKNTSWKELEVKWNGRIYGRLQRSNEPGDREETALWGLRQTDALTRTWPEYVNPLTEPEPVLLSPKTTGACVSSVSPSAKIEKIIHTAQNLHRKWNELVIGFGRASRGHPPQAHRRSPDTDVQRSTQGQQPSWRMMCTMPSPPTSSCLV